jgi:hypothetical protein
VYSLAIGPFDVQSVVCVVFRLYPAPRWFTATFEADKGDTVWGLQINVQFALEQTESGVVAVVFVERLSAPYREDSRRQDEKPKEHLSQGVHTNSQAERSSPPMTGVWAVVGISVVELMGHSVGRLVRIVDFA